MSAPALPCDAKPRWTSQACCVQKVACRCACLLHLAGQWSPGPEEKDMEEVVTGLHYHGLSSKRQQAHQQHCRQVAAPSYCSFSGTRSRILRADCMQPTWRGRRQDQHRAGMTLHSAMHGQIRWLSAEVPQCSPQHRPQRQMAANTKSHSSLGAEISCRGMLSKRVQH